MHIPAGVWIDHRRAVLVVLGADGEHCHEILSNVEKHPERGTAVSLFVSSGPATPLVISGTPWPDNIGRFGPKLAENIRPL
jgi:hypothetical protein